LKQPAGNHWGFPERFFLSQGALEPQASPDFQAAHLGAPDFRQQLVTKNAVVPVFFQGNRGKTAHFT
jgi:hypothetical protein